LSERNQSFAGLAAYFAFYGVGDTKLSGQGEPERLSAVPVSQNFFPLLGVRPALGRVFSAEESVWSGPRAAMLSHDLWERRFASDSGIIGRALTLNDEPVTVGGVLPASFDFASVFAPGSHIDLFVPLPLSPETNRWGNTLAIVGRLKPGTTIGSAAAELSVRAQQISSAHPERNTFEPKLTALREHVSGRVRGAMVVLGCAVGAVMLIVCANLSNLLLARATTRHKEMAIRAAIGAGRQRLMRQMLTESVLLSSFGAELGLFFAIAGTRAVAGLDAVSIPLLQNVRMDATALAFTMILALVAGLAFGIAPAVQIPASAVHDALKESSRGSTDGKKGQWMRSSLVVSEIALACVLMVGAGLLIRSFLKVLDIDLGFRPEMLASLRVDPDRQGLTQDRFVAYVDEILRRTKEMPGIETAALTDALPLGSNRSWGVGVKGQTYAKGEYPSAFVRIVSEGYIGAMAIPLRAGRDLTERDTPSSEPVIMINATMASRLWKGQDPIGQIVFADRERRVVGVVGDVRHLTPEEGAGLEMYLPIRQTGDFSSIDLVVRTTLTPALLASGIRAALTPIAPNLPTNAFRTLREVVDRAVSPRRFFTVLLGGFAILALSLALLGIYGVISYTVNQRTQEIGVRMALGASPGRLQAGIIRQTLALAGVGMILGTAASWALARLLNAFLFGVSSTDPATFLGMLVILTSVAVIAGYVPARRGSRIDPMVALRAN
jgi:predicted permease